HAIIYLSLSRKHTSKHAHTHTQTHTHTHTHTHRKTHTHTHTHKHTEAQHHTHTHTQTHTQTQTLYRGEGDKKRERQGWRYRKHYRSMVSSSPPMTSSHSSFLSPLVSPSFFSLLPLSLLSSPLLPPASPLCPFSPSDALRLRQV